MITKVLRLTPMNVGALTEIGVATTVAATYAEFEGTPGQAANKLTEVMERGRLANTTHRSLQAVRKKLLAAAARFDPGNTAARVRVTPNVEVLREQPTTGTVKAVVIPADGSTPMYLTDLPPTELGPWSDLVRSDKPGDQGYLEAIALNPPAILYCNEEGKSFRLPINARATAITWEHKPVLRGHDPISGDAILVGPPECGVNVAVPQEYLTALGDDLTVPLEWMLRLVQR